MQHFVEAASAQFQVGVPVARGVIGLGGDVEAVEAVGALAGIFGVELSGGGVHFQGGRVCGREVFALVGHDGAHVQGVAGTPDAAFSVDEGLDAFLENLTAHVEAAQGAFVAGLDLQVGSAAAGLGHDGEGLAAQLDFGQAFGVGLSAADGL